MSPSTTTTAAPTGPAEPPPTSTSGGIDWSLFGFDIALVDDEGVPTSTTTSAPD
jgi:hypothetical protein